MELELADEQIPVGSPARALGETLILRSILAELDRLHPGAKLKILQGAHDRLASAGPLTAQEEAFVKQAHQVIDEVGEVIS
jgi:chromosome condensin MukBEF MukE localization factor